MMHIVLVLLVLLHQTNGHGRLIDPPSRASMFRFGYDTPPDYNDNQGFCGGKERLQNNNGQCGVCGDPWDADVKPHEAGGIYATGQIVRTYTAGALITATVELTANHKGYFEFRICVNNDVTKPATHECLDKHLLELGDRPGTKFYIDNNKGDKKVSLKLPEGVVCSQCVFQWRYRAGNSWGTDANGKSCVGCGPQEEYYACADISIVSGGLVTVPRVTSVTMPTKYPVTSDTVPTKSSRVSSTVQTEIPITRQSQPHKTTSFAPVQASQKPSTNKNCHAIGEFKNDQAYHNWCSAYCTQGICPENICTCDDVGDEDDAPNVPECTSYGVFKSDSMDQWCKLNCQLQNCPASHCTCA